MNSFFLALRFLTIIPLGRRGEVDPESVAAAGKYYPLVGLIIGGLSWSFYYGAHHFFPLPVSVGLLLIFGVILTGALHLDGLADCLDGLYGGTNQEERLRIMKDVHLGTMGVVGLILILGIKYLAFKRNHVFSFSVDVDHPYTGCQPLDPDFPGLPVSVCPIGRGAGSGPGHRNGKKRTLLGHPFGLGSGSGPIRIFWFGFDIGHYDLEFTLRLVFF